MFTKVLIANRGEIALRVIRGCRDLGIATVAVHSEADRTAAFVLLADEAVEIGPAPSAQSYLRIDRIIDAARATGAEAIHPGYGFLSENQQFARACADSGVTFIGPGPDAMAAMGEKVPARQRMRDSGVPIVPGSDALDDVDSAVVAAAEVGYPVLVKASAGGGGIGMRVARDEKELREALPAAQSTALRAFGNATVFLERYVDSPRHIEIQVLADTHGNIVHLGERECSIQRRHQKILEEAPSPTIDAATRARMGEAAVTAARAVGYVNAGTVEFIYSNGEFFFLEMNTRLQVEHPVTELVHGVDLVELQIAVAEGRSPDPRAIGETYGHAIEVRLYAEDPAADWQPESGRLTLVDVPGVDAEFDLLNRPGLRLDAGVETGSEVSTHYDAMLAKLIAWAPTREQATRRLAAALRQARLHGVVTNRDLLVSILEDPAFVAGSVSTAFLSDRPTEASALDEGAAAAAAQPASRSPPRCRRRNAPGEAHPSTHQAPPHASSGRGHPDPHRSSFPSWPDLLRLGSAGARLRPDKPPYARSVRPYNARGYSTAIGSRGRARLGRRRRLRVEQELFRARELFVAQRARAMKRREPLELAHDRLQQLGGVRQVGAVLHRRDSTSENSQRRLVLRRIPLVDRDAVRQLVDIPVGTR